MVLSCQPRRARHFPWPKNILRAAQCTRILAGPRQDVKQKSACVSVEKNYLVDLAEKRSKAKRERKFHEKGRSDSPISHRLTAGARSVSADDPTSQASKCQDQTSIGGSIPIGDEPDFRELLMLAIMAVILGEHLPELPGEAVGLVRGVRGRLAGLVVPDAKPGAAAIAELERFDRV